MNQSALLLADDMGLGKTRQIIEAAQRLFLLGEIGQVLIVCPAAVRTTWTDPEFGQLRAWLDPSVAHEIKEFHLRPCTWRIGPASNLVLRWIVTNFDFIRPGPTRFAEKRATAIGKKKARLADLMNKCSTSKTLLVLDESSAIKNRQAQQTKACFKLRSVCKRVVLLNGTPVDHSPMDLFSQANIMDPKILNTPSIVQFRSRYAVMGGWNNREIVDWINLEDLRSRMKPYVLRRMKVDCLDLPPKLPPVTLAVPLDEPTWTHYRAMRKDMITWLSEQEVSVAPQAVVKVLRLAQITSGYLGGVVEEVDGVPVSPEPMLREISDEKCRALLAAAKIWWEENPELKMIVWCRFRSELDRLAERFRDIATVGRIQGGQHQSERDAAIRLLDPRTAPAGPVVVFGNPRAGGMGLNLVAATRVVYASHDHSLRTRLQSEDRCHRPGQTSPVSYVDMVATGPGGQQTVDYLVLRALRERHDLAKWTTEAWLTALREEVEE